MAHALLALNNYAKLDNGFNFQKFRLKQYSYSLWFKINGLNVSVYIPLMETNKSRLIGYHGVIRVHYNLAHGVQTAASHQTKG
jgi:hypothetical protein